MTKAEATAELLAGATKAAGKFVTITRAHLITALSPEPAPAAPAHEPVTAPADEPA
jgi:hypothetical protein